MNSEVRYTTEAIDPVFFFIFGVSIVVLIGITAVMIYFVVHYRRTRCPEPTPSPSSNILLELTWTLIPTLIVLAMFFYGWRGYTALREVPEDALEVQVTGRMWSWQFTYPDGRTTDRLYVPVERAVVVVMTSQDVLHSFYVPAFRIKRDVVPGMTTRVWFRSPQTGSFDAYCAEYCGVGHSAMVTTVEVLSEKDYDDWYKRGGEIVDHPGHQLLQNYGCLGCHSLDGSPGIGPTLQGIFGSERLVLRDGREATVTADDLYLSRAIREPAAEIVKGYPPVMPPYPGMSEGEIEEVIGYLKGAR